MTTEDHDDLTDAIDGIARALRLLGNADAATPFGALEALGIALKDGLESIAAAIGEHSNSIDRLADAIGNREGGDK